MPDGTVIWTAPTGHTYTTTPEGALYVPAMANSTGELVIAAMNDPVPDKSVMMPRRKRTRAQDRAQRITQERRLTEARLAEEKRKYEAWLEATYEPPPF